MHYGKDSHRTCSNCGCVITQDTRAARKNMSRLGIDFNPNPLVYFGYCVTQGDWLCMAARPCPHWTDPTSFDANHHTDLARAPALPSR